MQEEEEEEEEENTMWGNHSRKPSSASRFDTTSRTDTTGSLDTSRSLDFSGSSTSTSKSSRKLKRNMSDIILSCIGLDYDDNPKNLPQPSPGMSPSRGGSGNLDVRKLLNKKTSFQVISEDVTFTWDEILRAANYFSSASVIGEGGAGVVYRGRLDNGKEVAVKRARKDKHDESLTSESFKNEIATLQKISHNNLVGFYGYLVFEDEKIIVVEYVPNGTLRQHLQGKMGKVLEFTSRLDIIIDIAHAITYLHTYCATPLIHRDIKSTNILLTNGLHAKVADFGLAKLASIDVNDTVVHTIAKGTPGYVDPEYFRSNRLSEKSDVYSFGVVLVEVITGKHPLDRVNDRAKSRLTIEWAKDEFFAGKAISTLDPNLYPNSAMRLAVKQIYKLAFHCLDWERKKRPTMEDCSRVLWDIRKTYNDSSREL